MEVASLNFFFIFIYLFFFFSEFFFDALPILHFFKNLEKFQNIQIVNEFCVCMCVCEASTHTYHYFRQINRLWNWALNFNCHLIIATSLFFFWPIKLQTCQFVVEDIYFLCTSLDYHFQRVKRKRKISFFFFNKIIILTFFFKNKFQDHAIHYHPLTQKRMHRCFHILMFFIILFNFVCLLIHLSLMNWM